MTVLTASGPGSLAQSIFIRSPTPTRPRLPAQGLTLRGLTPPGV